MRLPPRYVGIIAYLLALLSCCAIYLVLHKAIQQQKNVQTTLQTPIALDICNEGSTTDCLYVEEEDEDEKEENGDV